MQGVSLAARFRGIRIASVQRVRERFHFHPLFSHPDLLSFCIIMTVMQEYLGINNELREVHTLYSKMEPSDLHTGRESLKTSGHPSTSQVFLCKPLLNWNIKSFFFMALSTNSKNRAWNLFFYERGCLTFSGGQAKYYMNCYCLLISNFWNHVNI